MNKQEARSLLLDYIYGEISDTQKKELETWLSTHPDMMEELEEIRQTRTILKNIPLEQSTHQLLVVEPERGGFLQWLKDAKEILLPQSRWTRFGLAAAALFMTAFFVASLASVQVNSGENGLTLSFGTDTPIVQQGVDREILNEMISIIRRENLQLASTLVDEAKMEQEAQMQEMINSMLDYFDEQRQTDLRIISSELAQRDEEYYYRYLQTNENMADLLYALRVRQ